MANRGIEGNRARYDASAECGVRAARDSYGERGSHGRHDACERRGARRGRTGLKIAGCLVAAAAAVCLAVGGQAAWARYQQEPSEAWLDRALADYVADTPEGGADLSGKTADELSAEEAEAVLQGTTVTIKTPGEWLTFVQGVNAGTTSTTDVTVSIEPSSLTGTLDFSYLYASGYSGAKLQPLGTAEHPFRGTLNGNGKSFDSIQLSNATGAPSSYVGIVGYAGAGSSITGIVSNKETVSVSQAAGGADIHHVGSVVGFSAGTVTNCSSNATVTVSSAVAQHDAAHPATVYSVGGVAGACIYDVTGCSFSGQVNVSQTSDPVGAIDSSYLVSYVAGIVGYLGDETKMGTSENPVYSVPRQHGKISDCTNTGQIYIDTPSENGIDRFGQTAYACSEGIGGIAGYSQGSIYNCVNGGSDSSDRNVVRDSGYIRAAHATPAGGIVGSLRATMGSNYSSTGADDGANGADPLVLSGCTDYGDVYVFAAAGGIVGAAGTYTTVEGCLTLEKTWKAGVSTSTLDTFIIGTRWNKPAPAGIAGRSNGVVRYCANFAQVATGTYGTGEDDEANRKFDAAAGYYAAGICGMLTYYEEEKDGSYVQSTPTPEVYGCYNAGSVWAQSGMRQRGIVGNNDGYVHDNILLTGMVENDKIVYGDEASDTEATGSSAHNTVMARTASGDMKSLTSKDAVAWLNTQCDADNWASFYWALSDGTSTSSLNKGFPILNTQVTGAKTSIASATATCTADAEYAGDAESGKPPIPTLTAKLGSTTLVQNVDFRVVPQSDAFDVSSGQPYMAAIAGIGRYNGTKANAASYDIVKGSLENCTVAAISEVFDWEAHALTVDKVTVTTPGGTQVNANEYTVAFDDDFGTAAGPTNAGIYAFTVTATGSSTHFTGTLKGSFLVQGASLMDDAVVKSGISYPGLDNMAWESSTEVDAEHVTATLPYAGGTAVNPTVLSVTYKGKELVEGTDYRVVYGNSTTDDSSAGSQDKNNTGKAGGTTIGCVTIRYVAGGNFRNYDNMFFKIEDSGTVPNIANARIEAPTAIFDGEEKTPVEVYYGETKLVEGQDYTVTYTNNVAVGTASYTVTGTGAYTGSKSGTFQIEAGTVATLLYDYNADGTAAVKGVEYTGSASAFDLVIPDTVEHGGATYVVTSVAAKAFGGTGSSDFEGSAANVSKTKIRTVSIPETVTTIGDYGFGSVSSQYNMAYTRVTFRGDSQLTTIGAGAFQQASSLTAFTVPAKVATIGKAAFKGCGALASISFETQDPALPGSVASDAFTGVVMDAKTPSIYGFQSATAVQALAKANSSPNTGENGGRNFSFAVFAGSIQQAVVAKVPDQYYTGGFVRPELTVTLNGASLTRDVDYYVEYENNINVGTASYTVHGMGAYAGSVSGTFNIVAYEPAGQTERLGGAGRLDTMKLIVDEAFPAGTTCDSVILATAGNYPDALAANSLAGVLECPIITTDTASLSAQSKELIERLQPSTVYVMGGTSAISADVRSQVRACSCKPELVELSGEGRIETAMKAYKEGIGSWGDTAIVANANNYPDALVAGGVAYAGCYPIFLVQGTALTSDQATALATFDHVVIVGGVNAVSSEIQKQIEGLGNFEQRLGGDGRLQTAQLIAEWAMNGELGLGVSNVCLANAWNYPDALAGGPLAGSRDSVVLLVDDTDDAKTVLKSVVGAKASQVDTCYILGGSSAVSDSVQSYVKGLLGK